MYSSWSLLKHNLIFIETASEFTISDFDPLVGLPNKAVDNISITEDVPCEEDRKKLIWPNPVPGPMLLALKLEVTLAVVEYGLGIIVKLLLLGLDWIKLLDDVVNELSNDGKAPVPPST